MNIPVTQVLGISLLGLQGGLQIFLLRLGHVVFIFDGLDHLAHLRPDFTPGGGKFVVQANHPGMFWAEFAAQLRLLGDELGFLALQGLDQRVVQNLGDGLPPAHFLETGLSLHPVSLGGD